MPRFPLRSSTILLLSIGFSAALAVTAGAHGDGDGEGDMGRNGIPASNLSHFTDRQFDRLLQVSGGDRKRGETIALTHSLFNTAIGDSKQVPPDATYTFKDIKVVGDKVAEMLKIVDQYQKSMAEARRRREAGDFKGALHIESSAQNLMATDIKHVSAAMPTAHLSGDNAWRGDSNRAEGKTTDGPQPELGAAMAKTGPDLGVIVAKAVTEAQAKVGGISHPDPKPGNGGNPPGGGSTPNGPVTGGGAAGGSSGGYAPIGDLLGINNPDSPTDAMTTARERYQMGDISGGLADASRAISLGGGSDAYALRGEMRLDQKNYPAAYQDASQALQLDPANMTARTVAQFAKGREGSSESRSAAGGGGAAGSATGSAARGAAGLALTPASRLASDQALRSAQNALALRDTGEALLYLNRALEADPRNPALLNQRAATYMLMKDYKNAAADAAAGLALAPGNKALLRTKGFADLRGGHYQDALGSANQLLEQDSKDSFAFALRGHAYGNMADRDAMMADLRRAAELNPGYREAFEKAGSLQLPSDSDILFLFPGEEAASAAPRMAAPAGRNKKFGILVGVSAFGGLLLALGLMQTVLAPLKKQVSSVFTRLTRTGPSVAAIGEADTAQPASVNGLLPGLIRGQYEISRQIGQGGMGTVFEGTDRALGRRVAIKKMRDELRVNPQERARFVIEAKTVAALHHPSVVDIYAIAEDGADVYLIFEFVDGKTVHDLIQTAGRLALKDAARVTRAAADALGYAHSRGVIHRDMKPSNMMIDATGRVKVMDFGIARMAKDAMTRYSMTNTVVGTPPYMAPEQEQGQVRKESDVYALAVCAYEMLTGKLPFIGIGAGMLMNKINMSYVSPSHAIAGLPPALDEVFAKAFQAAPENRYRTPQEFADALEAALGAGARA